MSGKRAGVLIYAVAYPTLCGWGVALGALFGTGRLSAGGLALAAGMTVAAVVVVAAGALVYSLRRLNEEACRRAVAWLPPWPEDEEAQ